MNGESVNKFLTLMRQLSLLFVIILPIIPVVSFQQPDDPAVPNQPNTVNDITHVYLPGVLHALPPPPPPSSGPTIIDHNSVVLFERIPVRYLTAARSIKVLFSDRSVGANFDMGLDCLVASNFGEAPSYCRRHFSNGAVVSYTQADYNAGRVPAVIHFTPNTSNYNRNNWVFSYQEGTWSDLTCNFIRTLAPAHMDKQVLSYQFSYLNVASGTNIMSFWQNNASTCDIYDLQAFWAQHRDKTFILWTTSLSRTDGSNEAVAFNNQMRQYARDHNIFLMDFADIEAYSQSGQPCYDNRDGVPYTSPNGQNSENYPNDYVNLPAICQDYTTESDGGHLGTVSGGMIRTAKAFWVLMARVAGWDGRSQ